MGFSGSPAGSCALFVELLAIKHCLLLAWDLGYWRVVCESDSLDAIRMLKSPILPSYPGDVIVDIVSMFTHMSHVSSHHIRREVNTCADKLASLGLRFQMTL